VATPARDVAAPARPPAEPAEQPADSDVIVEYCGTAAALLHHAVSGRRYTFSPARRARRVSARDAAQLLLDEDFRLPQQ
jgi:hypothetical protein